MIGRGRDRGGSITTTPSLCPPSMGSLRTTSSTRSGANDASIHVPIPARSHSRPFPFPFPFPPLPSSLPRPLRGHRTASAFSRGGSRCARAQQCFRFPTAQRKCIANQSHGCGAALVRMSPTGGTSEARCVRGSTVRAAMLDGLGHGLAVVPRGDPARIAAQRAAKALRQPLRVLERRAGYR